MAARMIAKTKEVRDDGSIVEIVVWRLDAPMPPCRHVFKYRLYFGRDGECLVRYDNERGKGDHRHIRVREEPYLFISLETLLDDFERDVMNWSGT